MSSKAMRRLSVGIGIVALMALLSVLAPAAAAVPREAPTTNAVDVVVFNGEGASMNGRYRTPEGELCGFYVDAGRSGSQRAQTTSVNVYLDVWDPTGWPCDENGCHEQDGAGPGACTTFGGFWGEIPNSAFTRTGLTYALKTTVTVEAWSDCGKEGCPDPPPPTPAPITVPISLTWQRTATWEYTSNGTSSTRYLGTFQRSIGSWTQYSATGSGSFLGSPVTSWEDGQSIGASVNMNRQRTICRVTVEGQTCDGGK